MIHLAKNVREQRFDVPVFGVRTERDAFGAKIISWGATSRRRRGRARGMKSWLRS